jgi:flagellar biosynthesis protein FliQ
MDSELIGLGVQTFKMALLLSLPSLLIGMVIGLAVSIFQATTSINEMTLSFIPKITAVIVVLILTMPWMMNQIVDFSTDIFNMIPTFVR